MSDIHSKSYMSCKGICIPLEPYIQEFQFHQSCPEDFVPQHEQPQNQQFLEFYPYPTTYFQLSHHDVQSFQNANSSMYKFKRKTNIIQCNDQLNNVVQRHLPPRQIQSKLNENLKGKFLFPVFEQIFFQCSSIEEFDKYTTSPTRKCGVTLRRIFWRNLKIWGSHRSTDKLKMKMISNKIWKHG